MNAFTASLFVTGLFSPVALIIVLVVRYHKKLRKNATSQTMGRKGRK